jgi:CPA2 family monovalent cation:H+ antiporter-2
MRDAFAVLFFVSVGMLLEPGSLFAMPVLSLGTLAIVLVGKPAVALAIIWAMRYPFKVALTVAVALAQVGEFSFILASVGRELGLLTGEATNGLVAASIVSIVLNPLAFQTIDPIDGWLVRRPRLWRLLNREKAGTMRATPPAPAAHRAIIVGYGPTGRTVARLLKESGIEPTVIDLNIDTVRALKQEGLDGIYGDVARPDTLSAAGVAAADTLILTSAGMPNSPEVIKTARELNPGIRVLARGVYLRELPVLMAAGADTVYTGEGEVALAFIEDLLGRLGATAEQIDRERARAHDELFGGQTGV